MFEKIDLHRKLSKAEYSERLPALQDRLHLLQRQCMESKLATLLVFEGWDASGRGKLINKLTERLEPRAFSLHNVMAPRTYEMELPWLWRFWQKLPNWGEMAIFDRSWYRKVLLERMEDKSEQTDYDKVFGDIVSFERTLADDRYLLLKFFVHICRKTQEKRLKKLASDPLTSWRVGPKDWDQHRKYDDYLVAIEEMIQLTDSEWAPWIIVEGENPRWARVKVFESLINRMEEGLRSLPVEV